MINKYASDNFSKHTTKNPFKAMMIKGFNKRLLEILRKEIQLQNSDKPTLLDVGCGEGFMANVILSEFPDLTYKGIDNNPEAIAYANEKISSNLFSTGNIYKIDARESAYQFTICLEVLEHLDRPDIALSEILRVTNHLSIVSVPNEPFFSLGNMLSLKDISNFGNPLDHRNRWTFNGFRFFLTEIGYKINYMVSAFPWTIAVITK